jgi:WD40 repeat protein
MPNAPDAKRHFLAALELRTDERMTYLAALRSDAPDLHARVEALLEAHARAEAAANRARRAPTKGSSGARELPARLGRYELLEEIAVGGSGVVYRARQDGLGRIVAVKLLRAGQLASDPELRRFQAEAETAARLDHPNIVPVYEVGSHEGRPFISMKLVAGKSLDRCGHDYREPRAAAALVAQLARAVDHAHRHGVLHRDIKPSNVLIDKDGTPYVADFGLAKLLDGPGPHTLTGCIVGTPSYMAPEQATPDAGVTVATDVYALGCLLYETLAGRPPLVGESLIATLRMIHEEPPPPLRSLRPDVDRDLETICHTCLAKEAARRYATANDLAQDLERWLSLEPIAARPATRLERLWLLCRRKPVISGLVATVALLSMALIVGAVVTGFDLRTALAETRAAEDAAQAQLRKAYVAEARALRRSGSAGQRLRALELLASAAAIRSDRDLVREAVASLALTDLRPLVEWPRRNGVTVRFDHRLERYMRGDPCGDVELRRTSDNGLLFTMTGNGQPAYRANFSRDGRFLALTHHAPGFPRTDARFAVWDVERRELVYTLDELPSTYIVDFAPDRPVVMLSTPGGRLFERDLETGVERVIREFDGRRPTIVAYSPDGGLVAVITDHPGAVRVFALDGELVRTFGDPARLFFALAWSPDGSQLAAGSDAPMAQVWDVSSGAELHALGGIQGEIADVVFLQDDLLATFSWDHTTRLWDLPSEEVVLLSDAQLLAAAPENSRVGLLTDQAVVVSEVLHEDAVSSIAAHARTGVLTLAVSADGKFVASGGHDGFAVWDVGSQARLDSRAQRNTTALLFQGDRMLWVGSNEGLCRWTHHDGVLSDGPAVIGRERCRSIASDDDGSLVAALTGREILLFRGAEPEPVLHIPRPAGGSRITLSPGGQWVALGSWRGRGLRIWSTSDGSPVAHLCAESDDCVAHFSPDGGRLALGTREHYHIYRSGSWQLERSVPRRGRLIGTPNATRFSPDGRVLAAMVEQWRLGLLDSASGAELVVLDSPRGQRLDEVRFTPDGGKLVAGTMTGQILIWDLETIERELRAAGLREGIEFPTGAPDRRHGPDRR